MQWHDRIKEAPGECRSDAWWTYQLGKRLKAMAEASGLPRDEGLRSLTWSYDMPQGKQNEMGLPPIEGDCDLDAVAYEMAILFVGVLLQAAQREHVVGADGKVAYGVEQRAVEVKYYETCLHRCH